MGGWSYKSVDNSTSSGPIIIIGHILKWCLKFNNLLLLIILSSNRTTWMLIVLIKHFENRPEVDGSTEHDEKVKNLV
jgi:hypothetical protein